MNKRFSGIRPALGLSLLGAAIALVSLGGAATAQNEQAQMSVEAPSANVKKGGDNFTVNILANEVTNIAAFQFSLSFDPSIVQYVGVDGGPFLSSSGREMQCPDPVVDDADPQTLTFSCVTLGPPPAVPGGVAGADGSGVLATVTFSPISDGTTPLDLKEGRLIAAELDSKGMPVEIKTTAAGSSLEVKADEGIFSLALVGIIAGVVAVVVLIGLGLVLLRARARPARF